MKGIIIFFSGTGNTEYMVKLICGEFQKRNIQCDLFNIENNETLKDEYDFYVFASPIHVEIFPNIFVDWLSKKLPEADNKRCIVLSTQASAVGYGGRQISKLLEKKGYNIVYVRSIPMPNNYYLGKFKATTEDKKIEMKNEAQNEAQAAVESFLRDDVYIEKESLYITELCKLVYKLYKPVLNNFAKKNLTVDYDVCIKCKKCEKGCPVNNIKFDEKIHFDKNCIACQRCVQKCPVNAFKYQGEHFNQLKL
ncbi:EFR1 family ferrodoxin [Clostridium guangxiense]|uniref:EFR1 family ferrodoxin n=1 Tax=Clostridium guangxiense TaxID=1662055 RepID=UPI001E52A00E|nr:EFR1 family ferrodoxin [Clostridium guangxiense]MCD2347260.1 EFR1 family ferrodoxin [Clostridium guangxiense]